MAFCQQRQAHSGIVVDNLFASGYAGLGERALALSSNHMDLAYPIGKFQHPGAVTAAQREQYIAEIESLPGQLCSAVAGLNEEQLDTPYRPGGWTVRQTVHHLADSHMNSYVRFKLALTEEQPTVKPYAEDRWAELPEGRTASPDVSLTLLDALHRRWAMMLRAMGHEDFGRTFVHPQAGVMRLDLNLALYAWHGRHHLAHITSLKGRMGWT